MNDYETGACWLRKSAGVIADTGDSAKSSTLRVMTNAEPLASATAAIGWFADRAEWEALRSVGVVEAVREVTGSAPTTERRYSLSSLPPDIGRFARAVRDHWSVENQLHWSLDVSFAEDRSRARTPHAATNLATLRRITLNLLRADKSSSKSLNRKRLRCALVPDYLISLLKF